MTLEDGAYRRLPALARRWVLWHAVAARSHYISGGPAGRRRSCALTDPLDPPRSVRLYPVCVSRPAFAFRPGLEGR